MALGLGTLWAALATIVTTMVWGMLWYGPIIGKKYMAYTGMDKLSEEELKKMQSEAMPGYFVSMATAGGAAVLVAILFDWSWPGPGYSSQALYGMSIATTGFLAFWVPGTFTNLFFEKKPYGLWAIHLGYWGVIAVLTGLYVGLFATP